MSNIPDRKGLTLPSTSRGVGAVNDNTFLFGRFVSSGMLWVKEMWQNVLASLNANLGE